MSDIVESSPAEEASKRALDEVYESIERGQSFKLGRVPAKHIR